MARPASQSQLSKEDTAYLERTLANLPSSRSDNVDGEADGLLKFGYHQNPYLRTFVKVLWSGYAFARGQLAEGNQRFSQARRDAQVSAIDASSTRALDEAAAALEQAMSPSGSIAQFLAELRDKTMPRLWSRTCETAGLPPPRFHQIYGKKPVTTQDELDAQEEAELAALRKAPAASASPEPVPEEADATAPFEEGEDEGEAAPVRERTERAPRPAVAQKEAQGGESVHVTVSRSGGAEAAAELLLSAASEVLRELRGKKASGTLRFQIVVEGQQPRAESRPEGKGEGDGGQRRRRRRRR